MTRESTCPRTLYNLRLPSNGQIAETTEMAMVEAKDGLKTAGRREQNLEKNELELMKVAQIITVPIPHKSMAPTGHRVQNLQGKVDKMFTKLTNIII